MPYNQLKQCKERLNLDSNEISSGVRFDTEALPYLAKIPAKVCGDFEGFMGQNKLVQCGSAVLGFCAVV